MTRGARKEGLSRRHRFVGRGSFAPALRSSRKLRTQALLLHVAAGEAGASRLGLMAPKRLARRSVERNRLKRLAREAFRRHAVKQAGLDLVLALREPFRPEAEAAWLAQLQELLARAATGVR
jgi:ribonuclease P protein component